MPKDGLHQTMLRVEDAPLLTGRGQFFDDLRSFGPCPGFAIMRKCGRLDIYVVVFWKGRGAVIQRVWRQRRTNKHPLPVPCRLHHLASRVEFCARDIFSQCRPHRQRSNTDCSAN